MVDHHRAAGRQLYRAGISRLDLVLDLEAGKEGDVVAIQLDPLDVVRHDHAHEGGRLLEDVVGVDQDFADLGRVVVADGPDDQAGLEVNEDGRLVLACGSVDGAPKLQQIGKVPLQFFDATADTGGAGDDAHALRDIELVHGFAKFLTVFAFHPARNAAAARIVGHQDQITASQ